MRLLQLDKNLDLLTEDRLQLLCRNKKELCDKINITTELLDILVKKGVIATNNKQQITVRLFL